jgi:hypothetical protein
MTNNYYSVTWCNECKEVIQKMFIKRKGHLQQSLDFVELASVSNHSLYLIRLLYFVMFFDSCVCSCVPARGLLGVALCIDNT